MEGHLNVVTVNTKQVFRCQAFHREHIFSYTLGDEETGGSERLCDSPKDMNSVGPEPGFGPET